VSLHGRLTTTLAANRPNRTNPTAHNPAAWGAISYLEADANCPDILQFQGRLLAHQLAFVPGNSLQDSMTELFQAPIDVNDEPSLNPLPMDGARAADGFWGRDQSETLVRGDYTAR
jgi:hypothetical protein